MSPITKPEPRSGEVLPSLGDTPRAGSPDRQIALQNLAWTMLELYQTPSGLVRTRLSNAWLSEHGWRIQFVPHHLLGWNHEWVVPIVRIIQLRKENSLYGTVVEPDDLRVSAVWQVPSEANYINRFFQAHYCRFHILFPEDLSFAIHANDGDFAIYAGPEAFIRDALPPEAIGAAATAEVVEEIEEEHGEGAIDGILAHYASFMID